MDHHEPAPAATGLELLFQHVRELVRGIGEGAVVVGRGAQDVFEELLARDLRVAAERIGELVDEADRRGIGGGDLLVELRQLEARRQLGEIVS